MRSLKSASIVAAIAASSFAATTFAAPAIPWAVPNGSNSSFIWSNGGSDNGLFGTPSSITNGGIALSPSNFRAQASNGAANQVSDRLEFDIEVVQPLVGFRRDIDVVRIREAGDFQVLTGAGGSAGVAAGGALFVTVLETIPGSGAPLIGTTLGTGGDFTHFGPSFDYANFPAFFGANSFASRLWEGNLFIDLPSGITKIKIVLNNILQVTAGAQSSALIEKKAVGIPVNIEIFQGDIPEPATMMVLGAAGMLILRRRSKNA